MAGFVTPVNDANFEKEVLKSDKLVLIDFYADWCGPCKALAPRLEKFAEAHQADVKVVKINVDENPKLAAAFGVRSIPMLVTMKDGEAVYKAMGAVPDSTLENMCKQSLQSQHPDDIKNNQTRDPFNRPKPPRL